MKKKNTFLSLKQNMFQMKLSSITGWKLHWTCQWVRQKYRNNKIIQNILSQLQHDNNRDVEQNNEGNTNKTREEAINQHDKFAYKFGSKENKMQATVGRWIMQYIEKPVKSTRQPSTGSWSKLILSSGSSFNWLFILIKFFLPFLCL